MANMNFGVNILPKANNTYSLGNSNYKWNIYANTINGVSPENLGLPTVTSSDNDKILKVVNGAWSITTAGYLTAHQDISSKANSADLATVATTGDYADLINKPTIPIIPTNISSFTNDSGYITSVPVMVGATSSASSTSGLVPVATSADVNKFLSGDGTWKSGGLPMVILSYGNSTWASFIDAYNNNVIVYCRASSNSNPASGSQTRMAFMAYVNDASNPTNVEFQYYRSVNPTSKSMSQLCDQIFVYKLDKNSGWSVTTREAGVKTIEFAAGTGLTGTFTASNGKLTISTT